MSAMYGKRYEDYIKVIYRIAKEKGHVRLKDVADAMNLRPPTVLQYIMKLSERGLVEYSKGEIKLTQDGIAQAEKIEHQYNVIVKFLINVLGVPEERAKEEACFVEHGFSEDTIRRLERLVERFRRSKKCKEECLSGITS
ncbi:iron-dependent repressor [Ignicoccus pacificus DSM 13166]|uniref:Iron-dependent repressor n=1 Tax=Ignicoccus pacificus DSM 13166 TaxID=940294 RepID=A0A977PKY1_9CREN|nr:iron-dependent repressor [Ignicoccus pacificus DSM 13166]